MSADAIKIFISYAHEDEDLQQKLRKHLDILGLDVWVDREIRPGTEWNADIDRELEAADIILLLLSVDFLSSDFVRKIEIPRALERHELGVSRVVPVLLRTVSWDHLPLAALQAIPSDERWVTGTGAWNSLDEAITHVAKAVSEIARDLEGTKQERLAAQLRAEEDRRATEQKAADDYRREVAEALSDGRISAIEKETLEEARERLGLDAALAREIEDGELHPYNEREQNRARYAASVRTAILEGGFPLTPEFLDELRKRQAKLGLQDEDIVGVADEVAVAVAAEVEAERAAAAAAAAAPPPVSPGTATAPNGPAPASYEAVVLPRAHSSCIRSLAFSPDGALLAAASDDRTASVYDLESGEVVGNIGGHNGFVQCVAFSPDGTMLATAGADKVVHIWDASGERIGSLEGHSKGVQSVAFSADGSRIITGSDDKTVGVWDAESFENIAVLSGHEKGVLAVACSPDGSSFASAGGDKMVVVWDAEALTGTALNGHDGPIRGLAYSHDGTALASASDDATVRLWDMSDGSSVSLTGYKNWVRALAFSPDDSLLATGDDDKSVTVWDLPTGDSIDLASHTDGVFAVAWSPSGVLASGGGGMVMRGDNQVRLWFPADD